MEQQVNDDTLLKTYVTMHEPQGLWIRKQKSIVSARYCNHVSSNSGKASLLTLEARAATAATDPMTAPTTTLVIKETTLTRKRQRSLPSKQRALETQNCGTDPKICYSDDSSDSSSESSDRDHRLESNKRRKSASWPHRSRSSGGADEDIEYQVEQTLEARVCWESYSIVSNG
jgi:hypothetical protein